MIAIRLLIPRQDRRAWLQSVLEADCELKVVGGGADVDDITKQIDCGADVIAVDLNHPHASESRFWSALHVYFPGSRLMVLAEAPIDPAGLEAALHAGAYYMVEWSEPTRRLWRAAHAAGHGDGFIPLGNVLRAICAYFADRGQGTEKIRIGDRRFDPQRSVVEFGHYQVPLTQLEQELLLYLAANAGRPIPTDELMQAVWHQATLPGHVSGPIKSTVKRLRQKLELDPAHPKYLLNRHGHGYYVPKSVVE